MSIASLAGMRCNLLVCAAAALVACGGRNLSPRAKTSDAGPTGATTDDAGVGRVPRRHRAAGATCSVDRGPGSFVTRADACAPDAGPASQFVGCRTDSECTTGANGRCSFAGPIACLSHCSYDDCFSDADCAGGVPCQCREAFDPSQANTCVTSSGCGVDGDCGPSGFCSPSVVGQFCSCLSPALCDTSTHCYAGTTEVPCACGDACGHGYFCHTSSDICVDDEDCGAGGTCNYDRLAKRWACATCLPIP